MGFPPQIARLGGRAAARYDDGMTRYSVAEAQSDFVRLVDVAERGEEVVIDRPNPDVVVKVVAQRVRPRSAHDVEWLDAVRVHPRRGPVNTAAALREMKDEKGR